VAVAGEQTLVEGYLQAPAAAAMFVLAHRAGYDASALADPATISALAASAIGQLTPWNGAEPASEVRARVLRLVGPLRPLVTAVVTDPRNAWWGAPLDRSAQLLVTELESDPLHLSPPVGRNTSWETYAQRPARGLRTSTELHACVEQELRSGAHAELACGCGDWSPDFPVHQTRLHVLPAARVYEVRSAQDWHALALRYRETNDAPPDGNLLSSGGIDHGPAPVWSRVAQEWDAVHLSFAGLLTALYAPVTSGALTTTLWSWDYECTHWLRPAFQAVQPLPDLRDRPEAPDLPELP